MQAKQALGLLWASHEFEDWKMANEDCFLTHCFIMPDADLKGEWQIGYYNSRIEKMTSFFINFEDSHNLVVEISPETEVFKKDDDSIRQLDTKRIIVEYEEAMKIATELLRKEYPKDAILKRVCILQVLKEGQIWNVTFVSHSFATINVKLSSETGIVVKHDKKSLISFGK